MIKNFYTLKIKFILRNFDWYEKFTSSQDNYNGLNFLISKLIYHKNYQLALDAATKRHEILEKIYKNQSSEVVDALEKAAEINFLLKDYDSALKKYLKILNTRKVELNSEESNLLSCLEKIGKIYFINKNYDKSLEFYQSATKIRENLSNFNDDKNKIEYLNNLEKISDLLIKLNQHNNSEEIFQKLAFKIESRNIDEIYEFDRVDVLKKCNSFYNNFLTKNFKNLNLRFYCYEMINIINNSIISIVDKKSNYESNVGLLEHYLQISKVNNEYAGLKIGHLSFLKLKKDNRIVIKNDNRKISNEQYEHIAYKLTTKITGLLDESKWILSAAIRTYKDTGCNDKHLLLKIYYNSGKTDELYANVSDAENFYNKFLATLGNFSNDIGEYEISCLRDIINFFCRRKNFNVALTILLKLKVLPKIEKDVYFAQEIYERLVECYESLDIQKQDLIFSLEKLIFINDKINEKIKRIDYNLNCFARLAYLYLKEKNYIKSEELFKKIYTIRKNSKDTNEVEISESYIDFGNFYKEIKRYKVSEYFYKKSLKIRKETLEKNDVLVAESLFELANLYKKIGKFEKSKNFYIESMSKMLLLKHSKRYLCKIYYEFGDLFYIQNDFYNTKIMFLKCIEVLKEFKIKNKEDLMLLIMVGHFYVNQKELIEADKIFSDALKITDRVNPNKSIIVSILENLIVIKEKLNQHRIVEDYKCKLKLLIINN